MPKKVPRTVEDPPGDFVVFVNYRPGYEVSRSRIGAYGTEADARKGITEAKKMRRETYGGLFESADSVGGPVTYTIWRAKGWERVA